MEDRELSQFGSIIKTAYEGEADTNAFTDTLKTKLTDITEHDALTLGTQNGLSLSDQELSLAAATNASPGAATAAHIAAIEANTEKLTANTTNVDNAGAVMESDFNAGTLLYATDDDTPQPKTPTEIRSILGIEDGATADQTGAEIKAAYEAEANTNPFTDTEKSKLSGIADGAEVNVNPDWDAVSGKSQILNKPAIPNVDDTAYDETAWDNNTDAASKNAIRDKIASLESDINGKAASSHNHTATDITEDTTHRFVTDAEKSAWDAKATTATKLDDFAPPDDNTDLDVTTERHGLMPKLPEIAGGGEGQVFFGNGQWGFLPAANYDGIVTFDNLNTNGDVGSGSSQVAPGDHEHPEGIGNLGSTLSGTVTMDLSTSWTFYGTVTGATTFAFSNIPTSELVVVYLKIYDGGDYTITMPSGTSWNGGSAPDLASNGYSLLSLVTIDGGTTWLCSMPWSE